MSSAPVTARDWRVEVDDGVAALSAAEDGRVAVAGAEGSLSLISAEGELQCRQVVSTGCLAAAWSPDGDHLALGTLDGVLILDRAGTMIAERRGGWCSSVAWSPDGTRLASGVGRSVVVLDAAGTEIFSGERASTVTAVAWVNRRVASAAYGGVHLHHASNTAPRDQMPFTGSLLALSVSPDRKWIATGNQDATLHIWRLGRGGNELSMSGYPRKISALAFSPDSTMLASGGGSDVTVWDFTGRGPRGSTPRVLRGHEEAVVAVAWASRGGLLAGAASDGSVAVWHPARARPGRPESAIDSMRRDSPAAALCWDGLGRLLVGWSDSTVVARPIGGAG